VHGILLNKALTVMMNNEPLIYAEQFDNPNHPSGHYTMVEHLGIYDKDATWLL
jgi:hypothetical protein